VTPVVAVVDARVACDRAESGRGTTCRGRRIMSRSSIRSAASCVGPAGFAPSASSSPTPKRVTRRLRQQIGVDCQSMPTSHAAVRHGVTWGKARRVEKAFLAEWDRTRVKRQPRHIGLDEIQRGKGQRFWTVLSDVVHGEVIGLRQDRSEATATALLTEDLTARQRGAITAVCTDMHRPYLNAVGTVLSKAEIVFDKFHVLQHASAALNDVRRQEFFRAGAVMREHVAGNAGCCCDAGRPSAGRSAENSKPCSPRIAACSKRTCCGSNSIGCGPTRRDPAC